MDEHLFAARVRAVAAFEGISFVELVRLSGLRPGTDFRHADLSRTDLRNQDLTDYDLSHASLRGAMIQGAIFNGTVKPHQTREAIAGTPAVVIPIGERLLAQRPSLASKIGENVFIPGGVLEALQQLADAPQRRMRRSGVYIGDSSDLVRRRLAHHFTNLSRTLKASGACFVLFEPDVDLDFDILDVVLRYLKKSGIPLFVFVFPQVIESDPIGSQLAMARLRALDPSIWLNTSKVPVPSAGRPRPIGKPAQFFAELERCRANTIAFIRAFAASTPRSASPTARRGIEDEAAKPVLITGARRNRERLSAAVMRELATAEGYFYPDRFHVFIREDLYSADEVSAIGGQFGGRRSVAAFSTFRPEHAEQEFFVVAGPASSSVWNTLHLR